MVSLDPAEIAKFAALADAMFRVLTGVRDQVDKLDG